MSDLIKIPTDADIERARNSPFYKGFQAGRADALKKVSEIVATHSDCWPDDPCNLAEELEEWIKNNV